MKQQEQDWNKFPEVLSAREKVAEIQAQIETKNAEVSKAESEVARIQAEFAKAKKMHLTQRMDDSEFHAISSKRDTAEKQLEDLDAQQDEVIDTLSTAQAQLQKAESEAKAAAEKAIFCGTIELAKEICRALQKAHAARLKLAELQRRTFYSLPHSRLKQLFDYVLSMTHPDTAAQSFNWVELQEREIERWIPARNEKIA